MPDLVTALTTAPEVRPNSASNWLVMTWNSWIASIGVRACMPGALPDDVVVVVAAVDRVVVVARILAVDADRSRCRTTRC